MRFKGTLVLLLLCVVVGAYVYFYEIKGGEKRDQAKQEEKVVWKVPADDVQQLDLTTQGTHIAAVRSADKLWRITVPRSLDADGDEWNRLASSASDISREEVVEENAVSLAPFGLDPAQTTVSFKTKDGKVREIRFGANNPTGSFTYAAVQGKNQVLMVSSYVASAFNKKLDDLRNRALLKFEQYETQSFNLQSAKGDLNLTKEGDRWWIQGKTRWAADSSAVNALLGDIANGRIKEFFDENPDDYSNLRWDKPTADVRLTVGKDKGIKHLTIGWEKSKLVRIGQAPKPEEKKTEEKKTEGTTPVLYIARDESRPDLFFVDKELVDKLLKSPSDLRDKTLALYQRSDIDSIAVTNSKGTVTLSKSQSGDWVVGKDKKKAKWDAVNDVFDAMEKPVKEFVDEPGALSKYGLDAPVARVVLKQGANVKAECIFGKDAKDGIYAQVLGEPFVKVADKDSLAKIGKAEADYVEPPPPPPAPASPKK